MVRPSAMDRMEAGFEAAYLGAWAHYEKLARNRKYVDASLIAKAYQRASKLEHRLSEESCRVLSDENRAKAKAVR